MRHNRLVSIRARRSPFTARLARAGSAAALALMAATCHSDNGNNPCTVITLAFTTQPTTTAAGTAINATVTAQDASGNTLTCFGDVITMALGTNPGGGTLSGTTTATAVSGVASFTNLTLTKASAGYTLRASGGGASGASVTFTINAGTASVLAFTTQPATSAAGAAIAATVTARDQFGNTATSFAGSVTMAIGTNPVGGSLTGTTAVTASAGIAAFAALTIDKVGTGYTLTAAPTAGAPPAGATSTAFNINPGPVSKLAFTVQPSNVSAGIAISPAVQVTAQDAQGNTTPAFGGSVTIAIVTNPAAGTLSGTATSTAVLGVATFANLIINKPGVGYTIGASAGAITSPASSAFNVAIGPLAQLVFSTQPVNAVAGASIAPAVVVTGQDAAGNTVTGFTGNVTVAIGTNPGSGTLGGVLTQAAAAGIATFNNLNIDKSGIGYTLTATSGGVPQVASGTFTITPAPAAKLSFTVQPINTAAGSAITPAVKVTALDQFDNVATSFTGNVSVAIGTNPNSGTLSGTASLAAAAGVATFSTLSLDSAGTGYTLTTTAASLTDATSSTFNIVPGAATRVVFTVQPSNATAGAAIAPAVKVTALDAKGNVATAYTANVAIAIGTNPGGGVLSGTATVAAAAGVATFSGLNINKSGTGYTLTAASGALTGATSSAFNIIAGAATHLVYTVQPVNTAAGAAVTPAITVAAQDGLGNVDLTYAANVTLTIGTNAGGGVLTGGGPVAAAAGVATFSTTSIDKVGTGYTLNTASGALTGATSALFDIFANTATHLIVFVQPVNTVAGVAIAPAVVIQALDGTNNIATGFTGGITIAIGTNNGGGTLSGTSLVTATAGVATFSTLSIDKVGDGYTLSATAGGVTGATSDAFKITPAAATHLVFSQQPTSAIAGASISPAVTVSALDAFANVDTAYVANIVMTIGANPGGGTLSGSASVAAVHGVSTFGNLSINKSGIGYTLHAASGSLTDVTSGTFDISPAALSQLVFTGQPTNAVAGATIQPNVLVAGQDAFGNTVTTFIGDVTVAIAANPSSGTLSGTSVVAAALGVATFSNLNIDKAGSGYTLQATATGASAGASNSFDVAAGTASVLAFTVQPASTTAGAAISPPIIVAAQDGLGNTVPSFTGDITMAIGTNGGTPAPGALSGTATVTATAGVATFSNLSIDRSGTGYTLKATAGGLADATSGTFDINPGTATKLIFTVSPVTTTAGVAIPTITVNAQDPQGNTDPTYTASVGVAITGGTGKTGAVLSGTAAHLAVAGVATFSGLSIDSAGTAYTLTATSGSLTDGVSTAFDIDAGTVTQLLFTVQPTAAQAGATITPNVTVVAKDAIGNINTGYTSLVTLTLPVNPGGATPNNASVAAISGFATFSALFLDKVGTGYKLQAGDGSVLSAQSSAFNITPGAVNHLAFITQPSTTTSLANIAPAVRVAAQDFFNNTVTSFSNNIVVAITLPNGGATLGGTLTKAAVGGIATFSSLNIDFTGTYSLTATTLVGGVTGVVSSSFTIIPSLATRLFFKVQPSNAAAGVTIAPDIAVEARDASGQVATGFGGNVTIAITSGTGTPTATLGGTLTHAAIVGTATFNGLNIDKSGIYKLTATDVADGLTASISGFFTITPGAAAQLIYSVQPSNVTALASITPQVEVKAIDAFGNTATSFVDNVTMSISDANASGGVLSASTLTKAAVAGIATFSDLSIDVAQTGHTLDATDAGGAGAGFVTSTSFDVTATTANRLVFTAQPTTTVAGQAISTVTLEARDALNSVLTGFNGPVTVTITAATGTAGATLSGTTTVSAVNGVVSFSTLSIDKKGTGYRLSATAAGLSGATSSTFTINTGAAALVAFIVDPSSASAGVAIAPAVQVDVEDALHNRITTFVGSVTVSIFSNPGGGTLSGTATAAVSSGVATFSDLSIDAVGTGYRLQATSGGLTADISTAFSISAGTADHLVFTVAPSDRTAGQSISPNIRVTAFDALGNVATSFAGDVDLAITPATGTAGAVLSGTTTQTAASGVATFSGLSIDKSGTGYTLSATTTTPAVLGTTSATFNITPAAATHLVFTVQPSNTGANATITPAVEVTARDAFENTVTTFVGNVTVAMGVNAGGGGSVLSGTKTQAVSNGVATFNDLNINNTGVGYTLTAQSGAFPLAGSSAFNIL
jgi:hypothetical protein